LSSHRHAAAHFFRFPSWGPSPPAVAGAAAARCQNADPGRGRTSIQLTERGFRCAQCHDTERGEYAARYEVSHGPVAVFGGAARSRALGALAPGPWPRSADPETTELQGAAFDVSASDDDDSE